jgi:septum formation protein
MAAVASVSARVVLASTSPYRRQLLDKLGVRYQAAAPPYEERRDLSLDPMAQVERHAAGKAQSLGSAFPEALVIGSDQGLIADGELLGKPGTEEGARAQLRRLSGRRHRLVTALALWDAPAQRLTGCTEVHDLTFRDLTDAQIADYVRRDQPLDCAGSFKIEALGVALFRHIEGNDPSAIIGMPMMKLVTLLEAAGVAVLGGGS